MDKELLIERLRIIASRANGEDAETICSTIAVLEQSGEPRETVWQYHSDRRGQWWDCKNCGKIVHKIPHDKMYCSHCGFRTKMES